MRKTWVYRPPWETWTPSLRHPTVIPIGVPLGTEVQVPPGAASYTGFAPEVRSFRGNLPSKIGWRRRRFRDKRRTVFRDHGFAIQRTVLVLYPPEPSDATVFVPSGSASYTGFAPNVFIKEEGRIAVPAGLAQYTGFAPTVNPSPEPEVKPGGLPYPPRRRRRFILPDGKFFEGDDNEALERLRQFLNQQAKEDQLTELKDEQPSLPLVSQIEDIEEFPEYVGGPSLMDLPALRAMEAQLQGQQVQSIDPQLLSVLLQRIDDEEAAMLLL